jgi:hypothetical protein
MRRPALLGLLIALAIAGGLLLRTAEREPATAQPPQRQTDPGRAETIGGSRTETPRGASTREPLREEPAPDAAAPMRCRVRDAATRTPLAGAELRAARDGRLLATTGANGEAGLAGVPITDVVFAARDHLLELHAEGGAALAELRQRSTGDIFDVLLHRDEWSLPLTLLFEASDGAPAADVRLRLRAVAAPLADGTMLPGTAPPAAIEAWRRHFLVATLLGLAKKPPHYHFATTSSHVVFEAAGEATIRFAAAGEYELDAVSAAGEVAQQRILVARGAASVRVRLRSGASLEGLVAAAGSGRPIAGATILAEPRPLGAESTTTGADGSFRLAPLAADLSLTLRVEHPSHHPAEQSARAGARGLRIVLQPRPLREVTGTVRRRPDLRPLSGARLTLCAQGRAEEAAVTGVDGTFTLTTALENPELRVEADGFCPYVELVEPGSGAAFYDLLPDGIDARVRAGLSARLAGTVRGPDHEPRPGAVVQLIAEQPAPWLVLADRRILEGGLLQPAPTVVADEHGRFVLECITPGPVRLVAVDGSGAPTDGLAFGVRLGADHADLILTTSR